ncbi:MAG: hypothetical protein ACFFC7_17400 [Candidatus Hermodarchaeota archaeon]
MNIFQKTIPLEFIKIKNLNRYLKLHLSNYPTQTWQDLYKFIYQGFFGSGHYKAAAKRKSIISELERTSEGITKTVLESLPPDGTYARLNFFPLKKDFGLELEELADLISKITLNQEKIQKTRQNFLFFWEREIKSVAKEITIPDVDKLLIALYSLNPLPQFHHSETYRVHYQPAYRVVTRKIALDFLKRDS